MQMRTHAVSIFTQHTAMQQDATQQYPMALLVALARGARVRVPKPLQPVCEQLQQAYRDALASTLEPTNELTLLVWLLTLEF
jgi:hypothetical protein